MSSDDDLSCPRDVFAEESEAKKLKISERVSNTWARYKSSKWCPFGK